MIKTLRLMAVDELTATRHNQRMQEEEYRHKTLMLEFRIMDNILLSFRDLIDSALPQYQYIAKLAPTSTVAAVRLEPVAVLNWTEFESCVLEHWKRIPLWTLNFTPFLLHNFRKWTVIHKVSIYADQKLKCTVCSNLQCAERWINFSIS